MAHVLLVQTKEYKAYLPLFLQHLRLLRHPNIDKFLGTQQSSDQLMIVTEPVIPVVRVLEGLYFGLSPRESQDLSQQRERGVCVCEHCGQPVETGKI